ncbi:MAG TPA: rhodanese-like domain-containing protein [Chloroflexota bacterium]|nr:rhodanese-like domain-containing protein [Chloroflexota bacterium]
MSLLGRLLGSDAATSASEVDVTTAHTLREQGAQLVDVREPHEFKAGHAAGSRNIPLSQLGNRMGEIATDRTVLLICRSGSRSRAAQDRLRRHGVTETRNVRGGMLAWHGAGLPVK